MKILGIDLETSGLDPKKDRILEIGAVLWDWDTKTPLQMFSALIDPAMDSGPQQSFEVSKEIEEITGISSEMIALYGEAEEDVIFRLHQMEVSFGYFMGHYCNQFDKLFMDEACIRDGRGMFPHKWLDTSIDIKFPPRIKTRNLRHLAAEHGFLNPFAHRAVFDVLTMLTVASNYRIEDIIARANEPTIYLQALVSYDDKDKAKERGYRWNGDSRVWWKEFKESDAREEVEQCGFQTAVLSERPVKAR